MYLGRAGAAHGLAGIAAMPGEALGGWGWDRTPAGAFLGSVLPVTGP